MDVTPNPPTLDRRRFLATVGGVNDIHRNVGQPGSPVVGTEFVGTSISTTSDVAVYGPYYGPMIKFNP